MQGITGGEYDDIESQVSEVDAEEDNNNLLQNPRWVSILNKA